jgi:hypothetical protein
VEGVAPILGDLADGGGGFDDLGQQARGLDRGWLA